MNLIDPETMQAYRRSDDIDQGIHSPDLMEINLLDRDAMDSSLGLGQPPEYVQGSLLDRGGKLRRGNHGCNLCMMAVGMMISSGSFEADGTDPHTARPGSTQGVAAVRKPEGRKAFVQQGERHPQVDQGRHNHVAGNPGRAVKVEYLHSSLLIMLAA
jgi:hypothetical protein